MSWIKTIAYDSSSGYLRTLYDRVKGPDNNVDNIMMAHSLRPHSMEGHMHLYKYVLHHTGNKVPKWMLEALGVYPSHEVVAYCRSGMRAAHTYVVLRHAGFPRVRLYDGSWQEWSMRGAPDPHEGV